MLARTIDTVGSARFDLHANVQPRNHVVVHDKPLQLLNVLANKNLSLNDAARELNISISTANQHIAAAKRALGANTTAAAIVAAVKLGLITIDQ
jgi:DNA-binding CsgD family transcriptional regulator